MKVTGDETIALDVINGVIKSEHAVQTSEVDALGGDLQIGGVNATGQLNIGRPVAGSLVFLRGDVNIVDGTTHPASLEVSGSVVAESIGSNGTLNSVGALTVGSAVQSANATINGNLTAKDVSAQVNLSASGKLSVNGAATLGNKLDVSGQATFSSLTTHLDGIKINPVAEPTFTGFRYQNSRIEFVVAGTLRAYIDSTGVHDA